jgi:hypothetical protein
MVLETSTTTMIKMHTKVQDSSIHLTTILDLLDSINAHPTASGIPTQDLIPDPIIMVGM